MLHVPHTTVEAAMGDGGGSGWALIRVFGVVNESLVRPRSSVEGEGSKTTTVSLVELEGAEEEAERVAVGRCRSGGRGG